MKLRVNPLFAAIFMTSFMVVTCDFIDSKIDRLKSGNRIKDKSVLGIEPLEAGIRQKPENRITIVNVGNLSRGEIGDQIRNITQFKPKVIGIDIIFACAIRDLENCPQAFDSINNFKFYSAILNAHQAGIKIVMAERLLSSEVMAEENSNRLAFDSIEHSEPALLQNSTEGYINLVAYKTDSADILLCTEVIPSFKINGENHQAFALKVANAFDSVKGQNFIQRGNTSEYINFKGNTVSYDNPSPYSGHFTFLDAAQALDTTTFTPDIIKDRIVLFGFHGNDLSDNATEDKYLTPLNQHAQVGLKPDMFGVVIHANIISMILNEDFIDQEGFYDRSWIFLLAALISALLIIFVVRNAKRLFKDAKKI